MDAEFAKVEIDSRAALRRWLSDNHGGTRSVWLVLWRKSGAHPERYLPYDEIVREALAFGWIDSLPRKLDQDRTMLLLSPRKAGSAWSALNKARVAELIAAGLMQPSGLARIEAAKRDGSWNALDAVETLAEPADLLAALAAEPAAAVHWAAFPPSIRRGILEWIALAKRPETRAARIAETARLAADNIRANQYRQPKGKAKA